MSDTALETDASGGAELAATAPPGLRTGSDLVRAAKPYTVEDRPKTWRLLITALAVYGAFFAVALLAPAWPIQAVASVLAGLTIVRLFIFYHDHLHGAILADSPLGKLVMRLVGMLTLNPPSVWKETHDYHHQNNAKLLGASIGSYPVVTVKMWGALTPSQRFWYAFARNPLTIAFGYLTIFMLGMCLASFARAPRKHWQGPVAIAMHVGIAGGVAYAVGPLASLFAVVLPLFIACAAGGYLFYAQHNFPDAKFKDRRGWEYWFAAVKSSSMFDMGPLMHWFTGNIGYHHVHHLNHKIPFYRLPEAMAEMPELQSPGRTTWAPRDVLACLRLKLWDAEQDRMVGWDAVSR